MNIEEAKANVGKQVYSCDAGDKAVRRCANYHGPYELLKVTKGGMCMLSSGRSVPPSLIARTTTPAEVRQDRMQKAYIKDIERLTGDRLDPSPDDRFRFVIEFEDGSRFYVNDAILSDTGVIQREQSEQSDRGLNR